MEKFPKVSTQPQPIKTPKRNSGLSPTLQFLEDSVIVTVAESGHGRN